MAKIHKVTWFFEGRAHGWTESLYFNSTDEQHKSTMEQAALLAMRRRELLGTECSLQAIRVSTEGVGPDAMLRYAEAFQPAEANSAAEPDVGVLIRCENAGNNQWKHIFLRGVWDKIEDNHGNYKKNLGAWKKLMTAYLFALTNNQWCWLRMIRSARFKITGVTMGAGDCTTFTSVGGAWAGFEVGRKMQVRVAGVNGKSAANGLHVVEVVDANNVKTAFPLAVGEYRAGGNISNYLREPIAIKFADDEKVTTRRVGAPLLESHGRRKAKPRA